MEQEKIKNYLKENSVENADVLLNFLDNSLDLYSRKNTVGHITGSAFILSNDMKSALLILHAKYNKWVAPGGHVDEGEDSLQASIRESYEEVGLENLELLNKEIFDIDIHKIPPAKKNGVLEPEHWHFDIRYLLKAENEQSVNLNTIESNGFKWNLLTDLEKDNDRSISRQAISAIKFVENHKVNNLKKMKI